MEISPKKLALAFVAFILFMVLVTFVILWPRLRVALSDRGYLSSPEVSASPAPSVANLISSKKQILSYAKLSFPNATSFAEATSADLPDYLQSFVNASSSAGAHLQKVAYEDGSLGYYVTAKVAMPLVGALSAHRFVVPNTKTEYGFVITTSKYNDQYAILELTNPQAQIVITAQRLSDTSTVIEIQTLNILPH